MKIGVKFCGGCNPRYDRGKLYRKLKADYPHIEFDYAKEGEIYDSILVIGGCTNNCASYEQYTVLNDVMKICMESELETIVDKINDM